MCFAQVEDYLFNFQIHHSMSGLVGIEKVFPIYKVENDCILSKSGDITIAFEATLPEIFTLSDQEYESFHHALVKSIKCLPVNSVFRKQDWFRSREFDGAFDDRVLTFLSHSSERFFNEDRKSTRLNSSHSQISYA